MKQIWKNEEIHRENKINLSAKIEKIRIVNIEISFYKIY